MKAWKKALCFCLAALLCQGVLTACGEQAPAAEPTVTEPEGEAEVLRVLTLGHSLTVDSCHMLNLVAATEGFEKELQVGTLYYSGCKLHEHVKFTKENSPVYNLYLSSSKTPQSIPEILHDITMEMALRHQYWDVIILQGGGSELTATDGSVQANVQFMQNEVRDKAVNPNVIFGWSMGWVPPENMDLLNKYPYTPNTYINTYRKYNNSRAQYYEAVTAGTQTNIVPDESFRFIIPGATVMQNAWSSYFEETDIQRDYVHATDIARLMVAYLWYCKLAGIEQLDQIKLDAIPRVFLKSTQDKTQDLPITEAQKAVMLESINNALKEPFRMTQSQYTEAPAQ